MSQIEILISCQNVPILMRCEKCKHVFSRDERVNDNFCKVCGTGFCERCGSTDFRLPLYSWDEWYSTCNKCGMSYG